MLTKFKSVFRYFAMLCIILLENVLTTGSTAVIRSTSYSDFVASQPLGTPAAAITLEAAFAPLQSDTAKSLSISASTAASVLTDTHRLAKRMDLELCLGQFDVHKNTIIRTAESQAIGGKYLQGLELDTMDECQRLCCETVNCDVYVFEDKSDGYCYLFECGPPENFHCKFTRHANYTSAVLTTVRHTADVTTTTARPSPAAHSSTTNISQQEWELSNLKVKPEIRDKVPNTMNIVGEIAPQTVQGSQTEIAYAPKAPLTTTHCGRFQFTCHSGECIAVYNACDGIPQCEDGSDEGPECSGASSSSSVIAKTNTEPPVVNILETNPLPKVPLVSQSYQSPPSLQQTPQQQLQAIQEHHQQPPILPALINNREDAGAWATRKILAGTDQQPENGNGVDVNNQILTAKVNVGLPPNVAATYGANQNQALNSINNNNNIYTNVALLPHAAAYVPQSQPQDVATNGISGSTANGVNIYGLPAQQNQAMVAQQGHYIVPPSLNWQQSERQSIQSANKPPILLQTVPQMPQGPAYTINTPPQQQILLKQQQLLPQVQSQNAVPSNPQQVHVAVAQQKVAPVIVSQQIKVNKLPSVAATVAATDNDYDDDSEDEENHTEPPKKKQGKHKKVKPNAKPKDPIQLALDQQDHQPPSPVHEQYKMIHENLAMEFRDHDGQSDRPGGAVLSLTLGVLVTVALALVIGCRLRTVNRRTRRMGGKTPYSHEADFLVNGMYL